jgi:hypothetical protein
MPLKRVSSSACILQQCNVWPDKGRFLATLSVVDSADDGGFACLNCRIGYRRAAPATRKLIRPYTRKKSQ